MKGTFKAFMNGENLHRRINWYEIADFEAREIFKKPYEELDSNELKHIVRLVGELMYCR
jgi:hypothetical protein